MSITIAVMIWAGGIIASAALVNFLRSRTSASTANGLGWIIMGLAHYPIVLWLTGSEYQSATLAIWAGFSVLGAVVGVVVYSWLARNSKQP
jgi:hypothetical protein